MAEKQSFSAAFINTIFSICAILCTRMDQFLKNFLKQIILARDFISLSIERIIFWTLSALFFVSILFLLVAISIASYKKNPTLFLAIDTALFLPYKKLETFQKKSPLVLVPKHTETISDILAIPDVVLQDIKMRIEMAEYDAKMRILAGDDASSLWPVQGLPYPTSLPILPFKRVVAYYGNLYSKQMGILGELPPDEMLAKLDREVARWEAADPETPVVPALHYIAMVAQADPGRSGLYRLQMPDSEIDKVLALAAKRDAIVFLDLQVALSTLEVELPKFEKYLKLPNVHLGIDPEFSMKSGDAPGKKIGTYDARDVNFAADYLARIVRQNDLPPKILVVHRFTTGMLTNTDKITPLPEVQVVIHMDGWGDKTLKKETYKWAITKEPVQFAGFKLFYKNDTKNGGTLFSPEELLKLTPKPIYIQYQ